MTKDEILIIDDEPQIRKLLRISLESNDYKVIQAASGQEGLALAANHSPDLILLDIGLPDISGHEVLEQLKGWFHKSIIILSVQDSEQDIVRALDNGAIDYLTKPFRTQELLARIRSAIRRTQTENSDAPIVCDDLEIDLIARSVRKNDALIKLTPTEYKLLALFARHEGMVLTHQYILKEIWGVGHQTETQYLRVFVAQLRKKLEDNPNHPTHIVTESGVGYRFS
ncbi:response regulator transcription factor [Flavilitoribacter nigricans]|uniref:DNA-binding response regulator n=1 Tax=Flavilitoribacter nigricans (strain ATCC 23147 / DSM 23189 / NBRC 102662 / NCIMB 1420 / SS-2) TaxID=1122177 RepID=A0A2D0MXR4_FLAN2|nr:response regulator transcription factor [Flavilitoribacter nigricans]PHN00970.1 DNA-binding response regulator [Flavilitoribacter nigricans DSM 23189 = NBRC 102662]